MKLGKKKLKELKEKKRSFEKSNAQYLISSKNEIKIVESILELLNENVCSFEEIVDKFKSTKYTYDSPCLYRLLETKELFEESIKNNKLNKNDFKYLLSAIDKHYELLKLNENTSLLKYIVDNVSFTDLVDKFKSIKDKDFEPCLYVLLENTELFEELIENNRLNQEDLRYLLNRIDESYELRDLCDNTPLIKCILNEFILNKEDVDRFNTMIENIEWCKDRNIHTIFDLIEYRNQNNEVLKLNESNKYTYSLDLNEDQRLELIELIQNNEITQNRLKEIIDNHLESNYDFESLMNYLKKAEKKILLNI